MDVQRKLEILADAAKYDASCASSGTEKRDSSDGKGLGSTAPGMGICHSYAPDGRCISLLKMLLTNACNYDCLYCVNRTSSNVPRARFTVDEVVKLTIDFYRRNYIEGLFLSSGIIRSADYTMEQVVSVARKLREEHHFRGYIHLKTIPEADDALIAEAGKYADRLSINIEMPLEKSLAKFAPEKDVRAIRRTMGRLRLKLDEAQENNRTATQAKPPRFAPAGQSTQMIIGADAASDKTILDTSANLYGSYRLKRVYYSAFSPIPDASRALPLVAPPLIREHRLYQADWLMRFYGFDAQRNRRGDRRHAVARHRSETGLGAAASRALSARCRNRQPRGSVARAGLRHQGGRSHHRHAPPDLDPAGRPGAAAHPAEEGAAVHRAQRSPPLAAFARWRGIGRAVQAEGGAVGIWILNPQRHCERSEAIHLSPCRGMDCFVASLLAMTRRKHMHHITLDSETDFDGWRKAARTLALNDVKPSDVTWRVRGDAPELFEPTGAAARAATRHLQRTCQIH